MNTYQDADTERRLVAELMMRPHAIDDVGELTEAHFSNEGARVLFGAWRKVAARGGRPTCGTVAIELGSLSAEAHDLLMQAAELAPIAEDLPALSRHLRHLHAEAELDRALRMAFATLDGGKDPGALLARVDALRAEITALEGGGADDSLVVVEGPDLPHPSPVSWIVEGLLRRKTSTLFSGPVRQGKSLTAEALALHVSIGKDFGPFPCPTPHRVLYLSAEDPDDLTGDRMRALARGLGLDGVPRNCLFHFSPHKIDTAAGLSAIRRLIRDTRADVVTFDTLSHFHGGDENDNSAMTPVMETFTALARETDTAPLLLHHHRKGGSNGEGGDDLDRSRGATSIAANCPIVISGRRERYAVRTKYQEPPPFALRLEEDDGEAPSIRLIVYDPDDAPESRAATAEAVSTVQRLAVTAKGGAVPREAIAEILGVNRNTVSNRLKAAILSGVVKVERGLRDRVFYRPATPATCQT